MGLCFSDVRGGKQAIGGTSQQNPNSNNNAAHNDAVDFFFKSNGQQALFTQVELSLSASNLLDRDITSKSDPIVVLFAKKRDGKLEEVGRTEVIMNNLNPTWIQKITIAYQFEMVQPLVFHIYDVDTSYHNKPVKSLKLKDQEFLGEANCVLSDIVTRQNRTLTIQLQNRNGHGILRKLGALTVHAEETIASRTTVELTLRCCHLANKDLFSLSDPFLRISRMVEGGGSVPICKTEVVNNNLNPVWRPLCLSMQQFGSKETPLVIECFDFNSSGNHVLIGKLQKSVADLETLHREKNGANFVIPSSHVREKVLKGQLFVDRFLEKEQYSFLDYISSGFELNFMVAVDFTASNGNPRNQDSLHYIDPSGRLNSYQQAIMEVGQVMQFYDSDRRFPAWGFGGKTPAGTVSHCFNLNGSANFEVEGVEGIMDAYATALHNVSLSGPTLFGPVINTAAQIAGRSVSNNNGKYLVLLIITDGVITDMQETKDALVRASDLPLSILIVGVGGADFTQMEILDADNGERLQSSTGRVATRDIVQFVPMREVNSEYS
ncbi:protein BONZAI 3 [Populus alba x Populus x berolinensis]|uniref:Protein BONZAI 3 n=1 Tax=Populus alba x Populus x berolinensis TaxID=444605 RepID=A0AAD6LXC4_9ROSI|nr:protein BONZAI 3 [Populus alba x Populus x berolinensis]